MSKLFHIPLPEPLPGHNGPIARLSFRSPTFDDYCEHGEPYTIGQSEDGALFTIEKPEAIWGYARACMVEPRDPLLLSQLGPGTWSVGREVRKMVMGFFQGADADSETSETSPTTSSFGSDNLSTPSGA